MLSKNEGVGPGSQRFRCFFVQRDSFGDMDGIETKQGGQEQITDEIETYIRRGGGEYRDWYVGMADNPIDPITEVSRFHKVQNHRFTYIETISHDIAKAVADYFVNVLGTDGNLNTEGISRACKSLYVYKKAAHLVC